MRIASTAVTLERGAEHVIARRSGHDIQHTQPDLVAREVTKVVAAVRSGQAGLSQPT